MAIRLPLTSSRMYTSSARLPLAKTSYTSRASSRAVPAGRSAIIRSTSSRLSRTRSRQRPLGLLGVRDDEDHLGVAAGPGGARIRALDVDLRRGQPLRHPPEAPGSIVEGEDEGGLLAAADLGVRQRLLRPRGVRHHHAELATPARICRADGEDVHAGTSEDAANL